MSFKHLSFYLFIVVLISCNSNSSNGYSRSANDAATQNSKSNSEVDNPDDESKDEDSNDDTNSNVEPSEDEEPEDSYPDDVYCAEVDYFNPKTGTSSTYTLTVEVEDHEVTQINFPSGWLDLEHFSNAELDEDGTTSFTSDRGYEYEVRIIGKEAGCFTNVPMAVQCRGTTENGEQCENLTDNLNGLCWMHQDQE